MRKKKIVVLVFTAVFLIATAACTATGEVEADYNLEEIKENYEGRSPEEWGMEVSGVIRQIDTEDKVIALTFDACGGGGLSSGYDQELIEYLIEEEIPATLFINYRWIDDNPESFAELAENPLFNIENHGYQHKPLSVEGREAYGIKGTESVEEVIEEVLKNQERLEELTGNTPRYFRAGTAHYDEVAVEIVNELGAKVIGFDINGDGGATFSKSQVKNSLLRAEPGSIVLAHMNRPESETAAGIKAVVPELRARGYEFVQLEEYDQYLRSNK